MLILIGSYFFYGWWDYRFLLLIFLSTVLDYFVGKQLSTETKITRRKALLIISVCFNLGMLGFFKYFNFFVDSWVALLQDLGYNARNDFSLNIVLPVGISFYTFQTMSYTIDVYRRKLRPTTDFLSFAAFVAFFPQLVAGPIERATNLLPQMLSIRSFRYKQGVQGTRLLLWGMFKKVVIADSLAPVVDNIFENYATMGAGTLWLGAVYFAFQIYCDFSGYSDIAIGTSKLFGFELMSNFKFPYFSRNIAEFWRRWHISLSTWFRDYLYIPLGGSKRGKWIALRNIFIIFIVSGFWHGANWTFIVWGLVHAMLYLPVFLLNTNRKYISDVVAQGRVLPSFKEIFQMGVNFYFVTLAWVFFRSENVHDALDYLFRMFQNFSMDIHSKRYLVYYIIPLLILEWVFRKDERLTVVNPKFWFILSLILLLLITNNFGSEQSFIYFQF